MKITEVDIKSVEEIKKEIEENIGKQISIKEFNKQGKKLKEFNGVVLSAYTNLFLVKINIKGNYLNKSFSYVDFLTKDLSYELINS